MPVDSKQQHLDPMAVIAEGLKDMGVSQDKLVAAVAGVVGQSTTNNGDFKQFGNTVFVSNIKSKDGLKVAYMRAFNADTARNYIDNGVEYFKYIIDKGVTYVFSTFTESSVYNVFQQIKRPEVQQKVGHKARVAIKRSDNGNYIAVVRIMEQE